MLSLSILLPAAALTRYDDHGDPVLTTGERLLVVMRRLGWATRSEINEALGIDAEWHDEACTERLGEVSRALQWCVKRRKVLVRLSAGTRRYRLNPAAFAAAFAADRPRGRGGRKRKA